MFGSTTRRWGDLERSTSWWNEVLETVRSNLILFETTKQSIFHSFGVQWAPDSSNRQIMRFMAILKSVFLRAAWP
jgi:hypothetical protein